MLLRVPCPVPLRVPSPVLFLTPVLILFGSSFAGSLAGSASGSPGVPFRISCEFRYRFSDGSCLLSPSGAAIGQLGSVQNLRRWRSFVSRVRQLMPGQIWLPCQTPGPSMLSPPTEAEDYSQLGGCTGPALSSCRLITHDCLLGRSGVAPVSSMALGLDASSLHPTGVALALCPLEQRFHQRPESPVPLVLR